MKISPVGLFHKFGAFLLVTLKPLGVWGLGGLALIDSALIPLPTSMDGALILYVANEPKKFLIYCIMAAAGSTLGSMVPYYVGRAGGELFLLKRINRERYEKMRDRFERQEFMAIMIPAMMPPPMPMKVFEFGAGVFEMKPLLFAIAIFSGKMVQFLVCALGTIFFGPAIAQTAQAALHEHRNLMLAGASAIGLAFTIFVLRKIFDWKRGNKLPIENQDDDIDATLIT